MRAELADGILALLRETRQVLRPSEILHGLSNDERFLLWPNCMHVAARLHVMAATDRSVRKVWMPLAVPANFNIRWGRRPKFRGWCVKDLSRAEVEKLRSKTKDSKEPPSATACSVAV